VRWRLLAPARRLGSQQSVAPVDRIERTQALQLLGPARAEDIEEIERATPVIGMLVGDQPAQCVEPHTGDLQLVEQAREFARQAQRLRWRERLRRDAGKTRTFSQDQARQQCLAALQRHGRRQIGDTRGVLAQCRFGGDRQLVVVDIADRTDARQQHRPPIGRAQKGVAQRADGAAVGQQDQRIGEGQLVGAMGIEQAPRQGIDEGVARRDVEQAAHRAYSIARRGAPSPANHARVSASACGVPTWKNSPSWRMP
jgi:hypothetical protein